MRELSKGHKQRNHFVCSCGTPEQREAKRREVNPQGITTEQLMSVLARTAYGVEIVADQWFGIIVTGKYGKLDEDDDPTYDEAVEFRTYVQCDELDLGLMKTWDLWADRFASINDGRRPWVSWEPVIDERDLRIDVYRAGNSHIAATSGSDARSAVKITHLPTGLSSTINTEKTQLQNKAKALDELREKIREHKREQAGR